jgi:hypothetical protein
MSEYKGIKGFRVQTRTTDPTPYAEALANNPYGGAWGSGGNLNRTSRQFASFGTLTAGLVAGGAPGTVTSATEVEEYDGTSWSEVNDMPSGSFAIGASRNAPQTNGIVFGGVNAANTGVRAEADSYDGTNWTEVSEMNTGRKQLGGSGASSTSALAFGGGYPGVNGSDLVETWDGSSWAEVNELNTGRSNMGCFGTATAAISAAGTDSVTEAVEQWNGSSWTEIAELNTERARTGGAGTTTDGLIITGGPPNVANTEAWNGSAWTEVNDVGTARHEAGSGGTGSASWIAGGYSTTTVNSTEEWTFQGLDPSTTPAADYSDALIGDFYYNSSEGKFKNTVSGSGSGTWASGANMNTARYRMQGGMGTYAAAFAVAGATPNKANVENYNGTSWTEVNDYPQGAADVAAGGTATAGITVGGNPNLSQTLEWDGTSFSSGGAIPVALARSGTFGTQTALVAVGGASPSRSPSDQSTETLHYDGSSWTDVADYPTILANGGGSGVQTAGIIGGGYTPADPPNNKSNTYNGSAWTEAPDMNNSHQEHGFAQRSPNSATLNYGDAPSGVNTEEWNGTSWTETNNLSTGRSAGGSAGDLNNALYFGGSSPALSPTTTNVTEEWSQSDFLNKLVTSS